MGFEGWYYKHQLAMHKTVKSLAIIPGKASDAAFILIVNDETSYHIPYPLSAYQLHGDVLRISNNTFSPAGISLDIAQIQLSGNIIYKNLTPIDGDIMGFFKYFPMECRHGVISMNHTLHGEVTLSGEVLDFNGGKGYIESDSGRSFPKAYTWVHCNAFEEDCSIMVSVARIPFYGLRFWGCICVVWLNGREYRLATYKGVKIIRCERGLLELKQGKFTLRVKINTPMHEKSGQKLPAPKKGKMSRFIRETLACNAHFTFMEGDTCLLQTKSDYASYEYVPNLTL